MDTLYEIVRSLLVIIVIASFLELILPDGRLRPFVRFSVGLFILIAILSPTLDFLFADQNFTLGFWDYRLEPGIERSIREKGEELNHQLYQSRQEEIKAKLQGQINAMGALVPGAGQVQSEVQTNLDGSVSKITLTINSGNSSNIEQVAGIKVFSSQMQKSIDDEKELVAHKIIELISSLYEIPPEKIEINFAR